MPSIHGLEHGLEHVRRNNGLWLQPQAYIAIGVALISTLVLVLRTRQAPPRRRLVFLLWGQSNMAGRGAPGEHYVAGSNDVMAHDAGSGAWRVAREPLRRDRPDKDPGVGPGVSFGVELLRLRRLHGAERVRVGLVPSAVGGSALREWKSNGGKHYAAALAHARAALESSGDCELAGILWHQGESDAIEAEDAATYSKRLRALIARARLDLAAPALPFLVGELGTFLPNRKSPSGIPMLPFSGDVSRQLREIVEGPASVPHTRFVSSASLGHRGDALHFSTAAQLELGKRYARAWEEEARQRRAVR